MVFHNCIGDEKKKRRVNSNIQVMLDMTRKYCRYYYYERRLCEKSDVSNADMVMICGKNCFQKYSLFALFSDITNY